jgi:nucleotide-binding universal stress UspA family protein
LIVVGIDGSEGSKQALRWALDEARLRQTAVRAVYAFLMPLGFGWAYIPPGYPDRDFVRRKAEELVDGVVAEVLEADDEVEVERAVAEGGPAEILCEQAKDAELLVVGSRGLGGFAALLLGSVGQQCANHAPCPLAIVRRRQDQPASAAGSSSSPRPIA